MAGGTGAYLLAQRLELLGVDVLPDALHVVPVGDDAVGERVAQPQQAAALLGPPPHEHVALERARQHPHVLRPPHVRREHALGHVLAREAGPDRPAAVVQHDAAARARRVSRAGRPRGGRGGAAYGALCSVSAIVAVGREGGRPERAER